MQVTSSRAGQAKAVAENLHMILKVGASLKKWEKQAKNSKNRVNILNQWISTERSYIEDLKTIQNNIQKPLIDAKLISSDQERILFPNLKSMIELSLNLTRCLQAAIFNWNPHKTMIGENLKAYYKFFMIYREYCNNFMKGQQIIKALKDHPEVIKIQQKLTLDLESYIIKPVQRPPKYQLLLRQYSKALRKDHPDYNSVKEAIEKYHQVNQLNNQSMDKQIRVKAMINLDKLYGGIIASRFGRQYLKEFTCSVFDERCDLHTFSDMVLILKRNNEEVPKLWKRLLLDHTSFIKIKNNLKYYKNMVFLCGIGQSVHLQFDAPADRSLFVENVQKIIKSLRQREQDKRRRFSQNEVKRSNIARFKVSKWHEDIYLKIKYKMKIYITVEGTLKPRGDAYYFIRFNIMDPFKLSQTLMITQSKMEQIQKYLFAKHPTLHFPRVTHNNQAIGFYDTTKNRTQIIQHRSFLYEECLNFLFRNEQFYQSWNTLADMLGLHQSFFQFASTESLSCKCSLCIQIKNSNNLSYYVNEMKMMRRHKKVIRSKLSWIDQTGQTYKKRQSALSADGNSFILCKEICSNLYFQLMNNIQQCSFTAESDYYHRILCLEARMGNIDYTLLEPEQKRQSFKAKGVRIQLLSIEQEFIEIGLTEDRYVRELIEEIGAKNAMDSVYDWGLFLVIDDKVLQMPQDQKILSFSAKMHAEITRQAQVNQQSNFIIQKFSGIKKIGSQLFGSSKGTVLFKKWLYLQPEIEIAWCKANKQRYGLLINQSYGRLKASDLKLNYGQIVDVSALYILRNNFEKIKYFNAENIETEGLREVLPSNYWPILIESGFKMELFLKIKNCYEELCQLTNQRNAIELIYAKTLQALKQNQNWITRNFVLSSYKGEDNDTIIGVSLKCLTATSLVRSNKLFSIDLLALKYKVTTFSLFIEDESKDYRFDGVQVLQIKNLIQTYRVYRKMYETQAG